MSRGPASKTHRYGCTSLTQMLLSYLPWVTNACAYTIPRVMAAAYPIQLQSMTCYGDCCRLVKRFNNLSAQMSELGLQHTLPKWHRVCCGCGRNLDRMHGWNLPSLIQSSFQKWMIPAWQDQTRKAFCDDRSWCCVCVCVIGLCFAQQEWHNWVAEQVPDHALPERVPGVSH